MTRVTLYSAALYALAFLVTNEVHELAHALAGLALDRGPTLSFGAVEYARDVSVGAQVATAAAGPLFSLVSGALLFALARRRLFGARAQLFVLWLAYHGLVNFIGYAFTTAFAASADAGRVARLLGASTPVLVGATVAGWAGLMLIARPFGAPFAALAPRDLADDAQAKGWGREVALFPALVATPAMALGFLPVPHWLSLLYVLTTPLALYDIGDRVVAARRLGARTPIAVGTRELLLVAGGLVAGWVMTRVALAGGVVVGG